MDVRPFSLNPLPLIWFKGRILQNTTCYLDKLLFYLLEACHSASVSLGTLWLPSVMKVTTKEGYLMVFKIYRTDLAGVRCTFCIAPGEFDKPPVKTDCLCSIEHTTAAHNSVKSSTPFIPLKGTCSR
jgi:hypothetical protein